MSVSSRYSKLCRVTDVFGPQRKSPVQDQKRPCVSPTSSFKSLKGDVLISHRSYREDFIKQIRQYEAARDIFLEAPASTSADGANPFREFIDLIAHVADYYPDLTTTFPDDLAKILTLHHAVLDAELREKIVGSLVLLRRKDIIDSSTWVDRMLKLGEHSILTCK